MSQLSFAKLQNGSDIRGIALPGEAGETPNLGPLEARLLSAGFLLWLSEKTGKEIRALRIAIGRDPRLSGPSLLSASKEAMETMGAEVLDCGLASTPAMFMSTVFPQFLCDGAMMITASHLPFNRNGFKYFDRDGGLNKSDITRIIQLAEARGQSQEMDECRQAEASGIRPADTQGSDVSLWDSPLMDAYCLHLRTLIKEGMGAEKEEHPLRGLKIVVDAGNGGGGFYALKVLAPLGADVGASLFLDPDGRFPNHAPNPENKQAMEAVSRGVLEAKADFGLIFDTDVDRSAAVDGQGREIARNEIVALAAALIAEEHPGTTVVTDSVTSDPLSVFLEADLGLKHRRFQRGYKNVINEAIRLNQEGVDCQLAIETSGHAAYKENYFLDDGAYLATKIVIKAALLHRAGRTLDGLISGLGKPAEAMELRFSISAQDFSSYGNQVLAALEVQGAKLPGVSLATPNFEGVRLSFDETHGNGWCLLRKSLHDPLMPLNVESNDKGGCKEILSRLMPILKAFVNLDLTPLSAFLSGE